MAGRKTLKIAQYSARSAMAKSPRLQVGEYFQNARARVAVIRQAEQANMSSHLREFWEIVFILLGGRAACDRRYPAWGFRRRT